MFRARAMDGMGLAESASQSASRPRRRRLLLESLESRLALAAMVEVKLTVTDVAGNPIDVVPQGGDFLLRATVKDLRPAPQGVFASYVDVTYDPARAAVDGPISFGEEYPNGQAGDTSTPGLVDEAGAFDGIFPLGGGEFALFSVPFTATSAGLLSFTLDPADDTPGHNTLLFGSNAPVEAADIVFVNDSVLVGSPGPQVEVKLVATDLAGDPITTIAEGTDYLLRATVEDVRPEAQGVFAAYVDVTYDAALTVVAGPIAYGPEYPNGHEGDTSTPGLIDEVGAFDGITPVGGDALVLFVIPMTATAPGTIQFSLDPADVLPQHHTLLFGSNDPVPASSIVFVDATLVVLPAARSVAVIDGVLTVTGGEQADTVTISQAGSQLVVTANFLTGGPVSFPAAGVTSILVTVGGGNDRVVLAPNVTKPAQVDGGAGNDTLTGGAAASIFLGGAGNDTIVGAGGRSVIIGGLGADTLVGGGGDDLLIAGTTSFDANNDALKAILHEWTSTRTYAERVANLRSGSGPVLTGSGVSLQKNVTVFDDTSLDILIGGADSDWFLYDLSLDIAADKPPAEAAN